VAHALFVGFGPAVREMKTLMREARAAAERGSMQRDRP